MFMHLALKNNQHTANLPQFAKGLYLVRIVSDKETVTVRIIKQKYG